MGDRSTMSSMALRSLLRRTTGRPGVFLPLMEPAAHGAPLPPPASRQFMGTVSRLESRTTTAGEIQKRHTSSLDDTYTAANKARIEALREEEDKLDKEYEEARKAARRSMDERRRRTAKKFKLAKALNVATASISLLAFLGIEYYSRKRATA
ncbi:unnamed protein product [Urochloa humidicola]